jgi:myosin heavy subunit
VSNWLEKNNNPVNESVVKVLNSTSTRDILVHLWRDHPGQPTTAPTEEGKKEEERWQGKTVSSVCLSLLMN